MAAADTLPCPIPAAPPTVRVQPSLFGELPEVVDAARAARRARAAARQRGAEPAVEAVSATGSSGGETAVHPVGDTAAAPTPVPAPEPAPFDPAALSQAELRALVQALPDSRLAFLLTESARTLKRRILDGAAADEEGRFSAPDPALVRAAAMAVAELSGEDDSGDYGETRRAVPPGRNSADKGAATRATRPPSRRS